MFLIKGIDVRKICSDTSVRNDDYSKLLLKNKALQIKLESLKVQLSKQQKNSFPAVANGVMATPTNVSEELNHHVDSGFLTKHSSQEGGGCTNNNNNINSNNNNIQNKEVLISRMEPSQTEIDAQTENNTVFTPSIGVDNNAVFTPSRNEEETKRLKQEITQMREIYESHMKVCTNRVARRSASSSSQFQQESVYVEETRRKNIMLEQTIDELQKNLKYKEKYCEQLQEQIYSMKNAMNNNTGGDISPVALGKLEDLVDVIMQQKQPSTTSITTTSSTTPSSALFDTEVFKSVITNSLHTFQDELSSDHETMRQSIRNSTREILSAVESIRNDRKADASAKTNRKNVEQLSARSVNRSCVTERRSPYVHSKAGIESIDELEGIRDRIDALQQTIFRRESDVRKIESERDRYSEELIKMVELMKKKDEEHG